jgi:hypothetical protein
MSQRERGSATRPMWLRVAALFCALLVGIAGIAQAAHIHGDWLPSTSTQASAHGGQTSATGEDGCPLCVAMHSALPVTGFGALLIGLLLEVNLLLVSTHKPRTLWYFAAFSRPPPSVIF